MPDPLSHSLPEAAHIGRPPSHTDTNNSFNSLHFICNFNKAVKLRTRCQGNCVQTWVYFCTVLTVCASNFLPWKYPCQPLSLLSPNLFVCEPTFRTSCMYFLPCARIDNWIKGSILSTQWPSLIKGAQSE